MVKQALPAKTEAFSDCRWLSTQDNSAWLLLPPDAPSIIGVTSEHGDWSVISRGEVLSRHESCDAAMLAAEHHAARPKIAKALAMTYAARQRAKRLAELAA